MLFVEAFLGVQAKMKATGSALEAISFKMVLKGQ